MIKTNKAITVYYDGSCPSCVKDRTLYETLAGTSNQDICWFDITDKDQELLKKGINPHKALTELHIEHPEKGILSEMDAYITLMNRVSWLKPIAWFISLPIIRPIISRIYHWQVTRRLQKQGRLYKN